MAPRKRKLYEYAPTPATGPLAAASLLMAMLRGAGARDVDELGVLLDSDDPKASNWARGVVVSDEQRALIKAHPQIVRLIRTKPSVSVAICSACDAVSAVMGAAPTKCLLTFQCEGKPVKPTFAKKVPHTP